MPLNRRSFLTGSMMIAVTATLAACSGRGGDGSAGELSADTKVELTLAYWDKNQAPTIEANLATFKEKYPNTTVTTNVAGYTDYWKKMRAQAEGKNLPDVLWMNGPNIQLYAGNDMLVPLDDVTDQGIWGCATTINGDGQGTYYNTILQAGGFIIKEGTSGFDDPSSLEGLQCWADWVADGVVIAGLKEITALPRLGRTIGEPRGLRRYGAAALEMVEVAAGRAGAFVHLWLAHMGCGRRPPHLHRVRGTGHPPGRHAYGRAREGLGARGRPRHAC